MPAAKRSPAMVDAECERAEIYLYKTPKNVEYARKCLEEALILTQKK